MGTGSRWLHRFWRLLGSVRLAGALLLALLPTFFLASLFPQMPDDPAAHEPWLDAIRLRHGPAAGLWQALGLFGVHRSPPFVILLAALLLNTLICTARRLSRLWRSFTNAPTIIQSDAFFQKAATRAEWIVTGTGDGVSAARDVLARYRYRVRTAHHEEVTFLYAERDMWSMLASPVSHAAAIVLFLALAIRPAFDRCAYDPTFWPAVVAMSVFGVATAISMWMPSRRLWLRIKGQDAELVGVGDFPDGLGALVVALSGLPAEGVIGDHG
jgi:hypothetical protein